jgi:hypothetical protein
MSYCPPNSKNRPISAKNAKPAMISVDEFPVLGKKKAHTPLPADGGFHHQVPNKHLLSPPKYSELCRDWGLKQAEERKKQEQDTKERIESEKQAKNKRHNDVLDASDASLLCVKLVNLNTVRSDALKNNESESESEPELDIGCSGIKYELDEHDLDNDIVIVDEYDDGDDEYTDDSGWNKRRHYNDLY